MCTVLTRIALPQCLRYDIGSPNVDPRVSDRWPLRERDVYAPRLLASQDVWRSKSALPSVRKLCGPRKSILDADTPPARTKSRNQRIKAGTDVASISARREMNLFGTEVLLVGQTFLGANGLAGRLHRWGLQCRYARNLREASDLLSLQPVDLVLSNVHLSDGKPFRLLTSLAGLPVTAFLCLPVEMSCFCLPALDAGEECLEKPALRPTEFSSVLKEMARRLATAPSVDWRESISLPRAKNGFHPKRCTSVTSGTQTIFYSMQKKGGSHETP